MAEELDLVGLKKLFVGKTLYWIGPTDDGFVFKLGNRILCWRGELKEDYFDGPDRQRVFDNFKIEESKVVPKQVVKIDEDCLDVFDVISIETKSFFLYFENDDVADPISSEQIDTPRVIVTNRQGTRRVVMNFNDERFDNRINTYDEHEQLVDYPLWKPET